MEMDYRALSRRVCICKEVDTEVVFFGFPYTLEDIYVEPCSRLAPNQIENEHWYAAVAEEPNLLLLSAIVNRMGHSSRAEICSFFLLLCCYITYPIPRQRSQSASTACFSTTCTWSTRNPWWAMTPTFPLLASYSSLVPQGTCYMDSTWNLPAQEPI